MKVLPAAAALYLAVQVSGQVSGQDPYNYTEGQQGPYGQWLEEHFLPLAETCVPDIVQGITAGTESAQDGTAPEQQGAAALAWFNAYFSTVAQEGTCDDSQRASMEKAFVDFKGCSGGLDMMMFVQYLFSAMLGAGIKCFLDVAAEHDVLSAETWMSGPDQIVLTDSCMEAMFGSNVMGDMLRSLLTRPDEVLPCFDALETAIPACTYMTWPVPIVGTWLKAGACLLGNAVPMLEAFCEIELTALDGCLDLGDDVLCANAYGSCFVEREDPTSPMSFMMIMPSGALGMPMMDTCVRVAADDTAGTGVLQGGVNKYNRFVQQCATVWSGWGQEISDEVPTIETPTTTPASGTVSTTTTTAAAGTDQDDGDGDGTAALSAGSKGARFLGGLWGF